MLVVTALPSAILDRSTSVVDSASTSADGLIWLTSGSTTTLAPTPAKATAATLMKSRRRGSCASSRYGSGDPPGGIALSALAIHLPLHFEDRKSTRLTSSH